MRIGIYGGTFNPPHLGHMAAAQAAMAVLGLDKLFFIPAALLGVLMLFDGLNGFPSFLLPGAAEAGETLDAVCNNAVIVGLLAGTLLIACSRERIEDEGIGRIRLNALLAALYANCAAVAAAALVTYGAAFLDIMIYNLFTLPLLFLLIFRWQLRRYAKEAADEE